MIRGCGSAVSSANNSMQARFHKRNKITAREHMGDKH
jgi:hypothetical protein